MLRNENIPGMRQEHAGDDADVALPMALPWMHKLAMPFTAVFLLLPQSYMIYFRCLRRFGYQLP